MLYDISNLVCAYGNGGKKVLHVEKLSIPDMKIVVILGLSGIGKSTLLETLGLMNNTISRDPQIRFHFYPDDADNPMDLSHIWHQHTDHYLAQLRNRHFSFIFQDTNLMPNFSAIQNIMLTLMLQGNSRAEARIIASEYLEQVGMGEIDPDKKVYELSGGQRQRIAFIRAICPEFTVLLGDEPTGNLDRFTSRKLMLTLQTSIHEKKRSAIIVSHDIDLSLEFADQLIIIHKKEDPLNNHNYGYIGNNSIFTLCLTDGNRQWINGKASYTDHQMNGIVMDLLKDRVMETQRI